MSKKRQLRKTVAFSFKRQALYLEASLQSSNGTSSFTTAKDKPFGVRPIAALNKKVFKNGKRKTVNWILEKYMQNETPTCSLRFWKIQMILTYMTVLIALGFCTSDLWISQATIFRHRFQSELWMVFSSYPVANKNIRFYCVYNGIRKVSLAVAYEFSRRGGEQGWTHLGA